MSIEDKYKKKNLELQQRIIEEMESVKNGQSKKNYEQLDSILKELKSTLNCTSLPLLYPRIIVDSWNFNDVLGLELLDLAELYKRWK